MALTIAVLVLIASSGPMFCGEAEYRGYVVDGSSIPVPDATVEFLSEAGEVLVATVTDDTGVFRASTGFPAQVKFVKVNGAGYLPATIPVSQIQIEGSPVVLVPAGIIEHVAVTALRTERTLFDTPGSISVMTSSDIQDEAISELPDAIHGMAGVQVQKTNAGGGSPYIRGMIGNQILILVDGIRLNNSTYRLGPNQYLNTIDPFNIRQIEVVRGPSSSLYGSDSLGGVVNLLTVDPRHGRENRVALGFDTTSDSPSLAANVNHDVGRCTTTASLSMVDYDDLEGGRNTGTQSPTGYRRMAGDFKASLEFGKRDRLIVSGQFLEASDVPRYDRILAGKNSEYFFDPQRRTLTYIRHQRSLPEFLGSTLTTTLSLMDQVEGRRLGRSPSPVVTQERDEVETLGISVLFDAQVTEKQHWIAGIEMYDDSISSSRIDRDEETGTSTIRRGRFPDGASYVSAALFAQGALEATSRLEFLIGSRYSYVEADAFLSDFDYRYEARFDHLTGSARFQYHLTPQLRLSGGVDQGFRAPGLDDSTIFGEFNAGMEVPNPDLDPETLVSYELTLKYLDRRSWAMISMFNSFLDDMIVRVPGLFMGSPTYEGEDVYQRQNIDSAEIYGAEMEAHSHLTDRLAAHFNIAWVRGTNRNTGNPLRRIPPIIGNASVRYVNHKRTGWIELTTEFADDQDRLSPGDISDSRIPEGGTPGYVLFGIGAGIRMASDLKITARLENLGDVDYRVHGSGIMSPGRGFRFQVQKSF